MDAGIEQLVRALNKLGIQTYTSCSGHEGEGESYIICEKVSQQRLDEMRQLFLAISLDEITIETRKSDLKGKDLMRVVLKNFAQLKELNQRRINAWLSRKLRARAAEKS